MREVVEVLADACRVIGSSRASSVAVVPAEDTRPARPDVELDVVREPLRELAGVGERLPCLRPVHSNRSVERVLEDIDRDRFMTPAEAVEYGLVDEVLHPGRIPPTTIAG